MFITLQLRVPKEPVECLINTEHVVWVHPGQGGTLICLSYGDVLETPESYPRVVEKLVRR